MKKIIYLIAWSLGISLPLCAQTQSENYVKTTTYREATTQTPPANPLPPVVQITYFDGLGRPIQKIDSKQAGNGMNIVTHIEYDGFGRQPKDYLPYVAQTNGWDFETSAPTDANNYPLYNGEPSYSEKRFEASPLNRVLEQAAPGTVWNMNNPTKHTIRLDYQTNATYEVPLYQATTSWNPGDNAYDISFADNGFYTENQLYKTITKDENWTSGDNNTTQEFKDKEGRVVLKRTFSDYYDASGTLISSQVAHDTFYVYDEYGNLTFVLPPLVTNPSDPDQMAGLCYQYKYDTRNRLVEKKLPGKQWEFIVYDKLDRVVATGPAFSPFTDANSVGWMVTKYDAFNRAIYTAWQEAPNLSSSDRFNMQQNVNGGTAFSETTTANNTIDGVTVNYSNSVIPFANLKLLTVNYYDDYTFPGGTTPSGQNLLTNTKGMPTATWVRVPTLTSETKAETTKTIYDTKSRVVFTEKVNHLGGSTTTATNYNFSGQVLNTITEHKRTNASGVLTVTLRDEFDYTPEGRLSNHFQTVNNNPTELIAHNEYDALGKLIIKRVGGATATSGDEGLQKVDYNYNIRGWLTSINDTNELALGDGPSDFFAFKINYNTPESAIRLYNGNISETFWRTSSDNVLRKYNYGYDALNRLSQAVYEKPDSDVPNSYGEALSYDKNGNIMSLQRNGNLDDYFMTVQIDDLSYAYANNSNQLLKVTDGTNNTNGFKDDSDGTNDNADDYKYDDNGNMLFDENKGITEIVYNHLNLPTKIIFEATGEITYIYNAMGQKVEKHVVQNGCDTCYNGQSIVKTDYLDGFQYKNAVLQFFPTAEGYVNYFKENFNYVYNYTDHLGNIRLSYGIDPKTLTLKIIEENHYYPFGLKHSSYNTSLKGFKDIVTNGIIELDATGKAKLTLKQIGGTGVVDKGYNYKYNGKELQDELGLNFYDYGARNYDPALGRWMNIDPLAEQYRRWSPYNYCVNSPLRFVDPDGMGIIDYFNSNGDNIGNDGNKNDTRKVVVTDRDEASKIRKTDKSGGTTSLSDVKNGVILPSDAVLSESLNVLGRAEKNGGMSEENSLVMNDGSAIEGARGKPFVYGGSDPTAKSDFPDLPAGKSDSDVEASIHSHLLNSAIVDGNVQSGNTKEPSEGHDGIGDLSVFQRFSTNIIVGRTARSEASEELNMKGERVVRTRDAGLGISIYNGANSTPTLTLTKQAVINILKN